MNREELIKDFANILNKHSVDGVTNTPDFILAEYLVDTILAYVEMKLAINKWETPSKKLIGNE